MATDVEKLIVRLEASQAKFEKQLASAYRTADTRSRQIERRFTRMNQTIGRGAERLGLQLAGAFAGAITIQGATRLIDAATRIDNALKVAGLSGEKLSAVYDNLFASAQKNAAPLETLVELYSRASLVQNELGVSTQELLNFTDKVALALRVSGQSAAQSSGALLQLSQALGSGIVRAEEFNSILEGALPIAQAAAAGLEEAGGSVARLRQLVVDGKVSSEAFFRAFEAGSVILEQKVAGAGITTGQAITQLENALYNAAREFNAATNASDRLAGVILGAAGAVDRFADSISAIAEGPFGQFISQIDAAYNRLSQLMQLLGGVPGALKTLTGLQADIISGKPLGSGLKAQNEQASQNLIQNRIDGAFSQRTTEKTGRLPASEPTVQPLANRTVSIKDYAPPKSGGGSGGRSGGRRSGGSRSESEYQREITQIKERTAAILAETNAMAGLNPLIDDYGYALEKAKAAAELELAAKKAGLQITPQLKVQIEELAEKYAMASANAKQLAESQDRVRQSAEEMQSLAKDVFSGFISDLRNGVSGAEALQNALNKVLDKIIEIGIQSLFSGFGGGGLFGGLFGAIFGGFRANGGPVSSGKSYVVGERGPEIFKPSTSGQIIPNGVGSGSQAVSLTVQNTFDGETIRTLVRDESGKVVAQSAPQLVRASVQQTQKVLPGMLANAQRRSL